MSKTAKENPKAKKWDKKSLAKFLQKKYFDFNTLIPQTENFIKEQKCKGKNIYYLSNISKKTFENYKDLEIWKYFSGGLLGFESAYKKPDKEIFQDLEKKYNLDPEKTWYIDDVSENLISAEKMGWQVSYFDQETTDLEEELALAEKKEYKIPKVLFLGKPNVGKSTLFNSMIGKNIQIVTDIPGTTLSVNDMQVDRLVNYKKTVNFNPIKNLIVDLTGVLELGQSLNYSLIEFLIKKKSKGCKIFYLSNQTKNGLEKILEQEIEVEPEYLSNLEQEDNKIVEEFNQFNEDIQESLAKDDKTRSTPSKKAVWEKEHYQEEDFGEETEEESELKIFKLKEIFDGGLCSFEVNVAKPDPEIFEILLESYDLNPENSLFIDDNIENVKTALELGMFAVLYVHPETDLESKNLPKIPKTLPIFYSNLENETNKSIRFYNLAQLIKDLDAKHTDFVEYKKRKKYILLDSTGIRKTSQRTTGAESFATFRTIRAAFESDVICFVLDGKGGITHQDQIVAGIIKEAAKGVVVIVNKSDLLNGEERAAFIKDFEDKFKFLKVKKYLWISAKEALKEKNLLDSLDNSNKIPDLTANKAILEKTEEFSKFKVENKEETSKHLIFDFDGVIGDTWQSLIKAKAEVEGISFKEASDKDVDYYKFSKLNQAVTDNQELKQKQEFDQIYSKYILSEGKLFEKFLTEIRKIKGAKIAIVSNSKKEFIQPLLGKVAQEFDVILDFYDSPKKADRIKKVCEIWGIDQMTPYYFTSIKSDVLELETEMDKSKIIGCSWGLHGFEKLKEVLPKKQILKKFKDIHKVFPKELPIPEDITNLNQIWDSIDLALKQRKQRITKEEVRKVFNFLLKKKRPNKLRNKKRPILYDLRYTKSSPPTFELLVKDKTTVHWSYVRFLENLLRQNFDFKNTEIKVKTVEVKQKKVMSY
jgi:GTP-binding protein